MHSTGPNGLVFDGTRKLPGESFQRPWPPLTVTAIHPDLSPPAKEG
jgi:hypothetical protein